MSSLIVSTFTGKITRRYRPRSGIDSIEATGCCRRTWRSTVGAGRSGRSATGSTPDCAMMRPRGVIRVTSSIECCSRSRLSMAASLAFGSASACAMASPFCVSSLSEFCSTRCPRLSPRLSDSSTRTSNHDSIERCRNWKEIAYTRPPGMSAISANTTISRSVSLEPNTRSRSFLRSTMSW